MSEIKELVMGKKKRGFSIEVKKHVIAEIESGDLSIGAASRKYGVSGTSIRRWRELLQSGELISKPTSREAALEKEVRQLREKVGEMAMEIDFLKKLDSYLRRLKSANTSVITGLNWDQFREDAK
jgi:transposase